MRASGDWRAYLGGHFFRALILFLAIAIEGLWLACVLATRLPEWPSASSFLFARQERTAFALIVVVALALVGIVRLGRAPQATEMMWSSRRLRVAIGALALGAAAAALLGHYAVYHDHALSVDEFMTRFGETTLLRGDLLARIPDEWRSFAVALQPIFAFRAPAGDLWGNPYRPVNAAAHALFAAVTGHDALTNATLTGLAVLLTGAVARQLWPTRADAAPLAALLVAISPQVVVTGMTLYAMPGHLALNLAWLWLFMRGGLVSHGLAAMIGFLAVGLHQINFHVFFVIPFLVALLIKRRWWPALFYAAVYAAAVMFWFNWFEVALWWSGATPAQNVPRDESRRFMSDVIAHLALPTVPGFVTMAINLFRFVSWNHLALLPLAIVGLTARRRQSSFVLRACGWGIALTVIAFLIVLPEQGHGWGYRYLHGFISSVAFI